MAKKKLKGTSIVDIKKKEEEYHEYIIMSDSEDFLHEEIHILKTYKHLTMKDLNGISPQTLEQYYPTRTSKEMKIQEEAFKVFKNSACKAFSILRDRAYVFLNLLQLMLVSDITEL